MRTIHTLALLALVLSPLSAHAADLTVQVGGEVEYDDNALRSSSNEDDDVLIRIRPRATIHEDRGQDFRYQLYYEVPFEFAVDNGEELDDIDHIAGGAVTYHPNDRLEFFVSDQFRYLRSALTDVVEQDVIAGGDAVLVNQERDRVTLNDVEGGVSYRFTPRLRGSASVRHELFETQRRDRADNWLFQGRGSLDYILNPKHTVGIGVRYLHQDFDDRSNIPGSTVDSYNAFLQWTWRYSETLQFQVAGGPTYIDSEQDDPIAAANSVTIPFIDFPFDDSTGLGLLDRNGNPTAGPANPGSIVVSQVGGCDSPPSVGAPVFEGTICTLGDQPTDAGILLDGIIDAPVIADVQALTTVSDLAAQGQSDSSLDFFASAVVRKDWTDQLHSALRYDRSQGGASGLGGAVIRDTVTLSNTWDFHERWQATIRSDWSLRQSVQDDGVSQFLLAGDAGVAGFTNVNPAGAIGLVTVQGGNTNEVDTMRYGVAGRLTHRFTRNTSAWIQLTYNEQTSTSDTLGDPSDFENFLAVLGVRHVFDPIKLW